MEQKSFGIYVLIGAAVKIACSALLFLASLISLSANAAPPELQTPEPVIYLADNIDEKDNLGWCIDTLGRGWSEQLQTHSCNLKAVMCNFSTIKKHVRSVRWNFPVSAQHFMKRLLLASPLTYLIAPQLRLSNYLPIT